MLCRASVQDVQGAKLTRENGYLVVVMRYYPRFIRRDKIDCYIRELAPAPELFADFKAKDRKLKNHNAAFYLCQYENRFAISDQGTAELKHLSTISVERDVYLICQCRDFDRCHADLLLMTAEARFGAKIRPLIFDYPDFRKRILNIKLPLNHSDPMQEGLSHAKSPKR